MKIFIGFLALLLSNELSAQEWCGTKVTPEYVQFIRDWLLSGQNQRVVIPKINKTLNITAWIVKDKSRTPSHDSTEIRDAIADLDGFFNQMGVSFTVCKFEYIDNWQFNTWDQSVHDDQAQDLYYQPNTINIYFTGDITNPGGAAGYAPLPPSPDFMVIKDEGSLKHEMGHFLGLFHTFENQTGNELVDRSNCLPTGDLICDTEADPDPSGDRVDCNCNYTGPPLRDANGDFYEPPTDNIMSYYATPSPPCLPSTDCRCRFTSGQYLRMVQMYSAFRVNLW